ncbi:MAG: pyridoxal-dependent decarboxylase, exosortase A system-associated [Casimicrobiaceae bacterium]
MTQFPSKSGELVVGGVPLTRLAERVGRTPFYVYDRRALNERVAQLRKVLPAGVDLHYAMKANPLPALVDHMARLVDGLDVASGGELRVALDAGVDPSDISFAGPGKSETELGQGLAAGILFNIESFREIRLLAALSERQGRAARVAVRVNPDFELKLSGMKMGGGPKQFGIDAEQVPQALAQIGECGLQFEGFHIFSGSQNLRAAAICDAQTRAFELASRLAQAAPSPVVSLNLGGGFGIPYFPGDEPLDLAPIGDTLAGLVNEAKSVFPQAALIVELGRYLVGEAGLYVCRILDRKISRGHVFLVTDGGLHHHLAASGNFGQVIRKNYPVAIGNRMQAPTIEEASVVGPLCTPLDLLADRVSLPVAQEGDLVVVYQSGAYGLTASPRGFLSHPEPPEILV